MARQRPRVMQSFRAPRPTTNPYIVQLDRALAAEPTIEHRRFSWPGALLTRVEVVHFHWPEVLLGGDKGWKRWGKRWLFRALLIKLTLTRAAIVRTAHNVELPTDIDPPTRRLLTTVENRTDHRILLNPTTSLPWTTPTTVIPHGHYVDWFADVPRVDPEPNSLGFAGLVRRYKGVESLIDAFEATAARHPELRLQISGSPSSPDLAHEIRELASSDDRINLDLRFLSEADFATAVMRAGGVVLPYRFMHNSGTVLAALSVGRPVLVPHNQVNAELAVEVGAGWIHTFTGSVTDCDLIRFHEAINPLPSSAPRLEAREWSQAGAEHARVYREAISGHRRRGGSRGAH